MGTISIIGATGLVGRKIIQVLKERNIYFDDYFLYSSGRTDESIKIKDKIFKVMELKEKNIVGSDYAFFSAGDDISLKFAPLFRDKGSIVIDNSNAFRMDKDVPLVVPEINIDEIKNHNGIISNPNCSTIIMLLPLYPIHRRYRIKKIFVSTYQSVSGAGREGIEDIRKSKPHFFPKSIRFNLIPQIGELNNDGFSKEEMKMINETRKILNDTNICVFPTCVRVSVYYCHSEAITIETEKEMELNEVKNILLNAKNVVYTNELLTPKDVQDKDEVFVSRLRIYRDKRFLSLWVVGDNLRKGAATNAVQILEYLIND
uniref:Aspartate-semialdehyde dehydrogenase n=1 Tax=candidate division WOR-3 bacterium TaxID=2052148 RepID=A0A7C4U6R4_UNCW3